MDSFTEERVEDKMAFFTAADTELAAVLKWWRSMPKSHTQRSVTFNNMVRAVEQVRYHPMFPQRSPNGPTEWSLNVP
jgi:hypothetical protein